MIKTTAFKSKIRPNSYWFQTCTIFFKENDLIPFAKKKCKAGNKKECIYQESSSLQSPWSKKCLSSKLVKDSLAMDPHTHTKTIWKHLHQWASLVVNREPIMCAYLTRCFFSGVPFHSLGSRSLHRYYYQVMDGRSMQFCILSTGPPSWASRWSRQAGLSLSHRSHSWTAQQTDTSQ